MAFVSLAHAKILPSLQSRLVLIWKKNLTEASRLHQEKGKFLAYGMQKLCWEIFQKLFVKEQQLLVLFNSTLSCMLEEKKKKKRQRNLNSGSFKEKQKYPWQRRTWCCVKTVLVRNKPKLKTLGGLRIDTLLENSRICLHSKVCHFLLFLMSLRSWAESIFPSGRCFSLLPKRKEPNLFLASLKKTDVLYCRRWRSCL